jgi:hypothetical protein
LGEFGFPSGDPASSVPSHLPPKFSLDIGIYIKMKDCSLWSSCNNSLRVVNGCHWGEVSASKIFVHRRLVESLETLGYAVSQGEEGQLCLY